MLAAAQETAALAHRGGGCRQLARHQVQAGWGCEWLLKAAAANAEEVGTYFGAVWSVVSVSQSVAGPQCSGP